VVQLLFFRYSRLLIFFRIFFVNDAETRKPFVDILTRVRATNIDRRVHILYLRSTRRRLYALARTEIKRVYRTANNVSV